MSLTPLGSGLDDLSVSQKGSSYMAGKRKRKGANEPVKKDVTPEPNDNAVAWRNFFNANYKALRAAKKGLTEKEITLTSNPVILPNYYFDSEARKSSDHFVSSINELKEYFSNELKSQLRSFSLKFMDKGEGVGGIDRELEEDVAGEVGKKAECNQAVEESPLKSPVHSKTNVVGQSEENVVESVTTPSLSASKSVEDEGCAHKTFEDDDFDIVKVASFWNKGKALVKSKKTQLENVHLIEDDFNDKAYEQFIESGRTVVGPFKTKEAISRNQYGFYKCVFSNTLDPGYVLAKFRKFEVDRRCMASLRPLREVEGSESVKIIDCFSILMNKYECDSRLPDQPRVWYMPTRISLSTLDLLFDENRSKNVTFVDFGIDSKDHRLPQQDNDRDCGVYVMKYMEAVANEEEVVDQFHPIEACLEIAARIITDEQNEIRTKVVEDLGLHKEAHLHHPRPLCVVRQSLHAILGSVRRSLATQTCFPPQEPPLGFGLARLRFHMLPNLCTH
ncbi:hypothetical protein F8388_022606 [Cannabis sativa]|uniref:Ubiquitin-like protease family profile domain-containing protein n=1 Tax=Cannabis sativa TaxID=3483 RepID=A0A7J6FZF5_CANSA|nr:hypothetical protein F8388_022606 [Cannabis sativa]